MEKMVFSLKTETKDGKAQTVVDYELNGKRMTATFDPTKDNEIDTVAKIFAGFHALPQKEFKAGDAVVIKDAGKRYRTFTGWAAANLKAEELVAYGAGLEKTVPNGTKGIVVKVAPKNVLDSQKIVAVQVLRGDGTFIVLFDPEGVEAA